LRGKAIAVTIRGMSEELSPVIPAPAGLTAKLKDGSTCPIVAFKQYPDRLVPMYLSTRGNVYEIGEGAAVGMSAAWSPVSTEAAGTSSAPAF